MNTKQRNLHGGIPKVRKTYHEILDDEKLTFKRSRKDRQRRRRAERNVKTILNTID